MKNSHSLKGFAASLVMAAVVLSSVPVFAGEVDVNARAQWIKGSTKVALDLFGRVLKKDPRDNVFISPFSVMAALTMTYNGANKDTMKAMQTALGLDGLKLDDVNAAVKDVTDTLTSGEKGVKLMIGNSIWVQKDVEIRADFVKRIAEFFAGKAEAVDFGDTKTLKKINGWVSEATKGKIKEILKNTGAGDLLYLINATYFKADWKVKFDKKLTKKRTFTPKEGTAAEVPMMTLQDDFMYYNGDKFASLYLPYANGRFAMYIFLPDQKSSVAELAEAMTVENWTTWMDAYKKREGTLILPSFKVEYDVELTRIIKAMGFELAFDEQKADFSKLASKVQLFISKILHKTYVEVNEDGTEAAAVTAVAMTKGAGGADRKFTMICDRPFVYVIRDNLSHVILFMGAYQKAN